MNASNFTNPIYLLRIKAAILRAVLKANRPGQPQGVANEIVYNRNDVPSLCVVARVGQRFEVFGGRYGDEDVTGYVVHALRKMHDRVRAFPGNPPAGYVVPTYSSAANRRLLGFSLIKVEA